MQDNQNEQLQDQITDIEIDETEESPETEKVYPSEPNDEGYFFEDDGMEALGIYTKEDAEGNKTHKVSLSGNRIAIIKEISLKEGGIAKAVAKNKPGKMEAAYAAAATTIDGKSYTMEQMLQMKAKDMNKVIVASNLLNFI